VRGSGLWAVANRPVSWAWDPTIAPRRPGHGPSHRPTGRPMVLPTLRSRVSWNWGLGELGAGTRSDVAAAAGGRWSPGSIRRIWRGRCVLGQMARDRERRCRRMAHVCVWYFKLFTRRFRGIATSRLRSGSPFIPLLRQIAGHECDDSAESHVVPSVPNIAAISGPGHIENHQVGDSAESRDVIESTFDQDVLAPGWRGAGHDGEQAAGCAYARCGGRAQDARAQLAGRTR
jgi:hypothetical protein